MHDDDDDVDDDQLYFKSIVRSPSALIGHVIVLARI